MKYSQERREAILQKLLAPNQQTVAEVADAEGISAATLYLWRKQARAAGRLLPSQASDPEGWRTQDKFNAVLETAALSEEELAEYGRRRGVYPEQIRRWRSSCERANDQAASRARQDADVLKQERQRRRAVERELKRKNAALAETAALLTLRKKAAAIWGDEDV